jgi:hypothetical protein
MRALITLGLFSLILLAVESVFVCPDADDKYHVNPDDCRRWIRCNQFTIIDQGICANNLFFSPIDQTCNYNVMPGVMCIITPDSPKQGPFVDAPGCHLNAVPGELTQYYHSNEPSRIFNCSNDLIFDVTICACKYILTPGDMQCPLGGIVGQPKKYFHISEPTIIWDCANDLVFNASICACTYQASGVDNSVCLLRPFPALGPDFFFNVLEPTSILQCPGGLVFNQQVCACDYAATVAPNACPLVAIPGDPTAFSPANNLALVLHCPPGAQFSMTVCNCVF